MLKPIVAAGAVLCAFVPSLASAAVPLLSGTYTYTKQKLCQTNVIVTYGTSPNISGSPFVKEVVTGNGSNALALSAGTIQFVQTTAGSGTATQSGFEGEGSAVLITQTGSGIGGGGIDGEPLQIQAQSGSAAFSQTATTFTLKSGGKTESYHLYYGKTAGGIVQNAVLIGLDSDGCVDQYSISHN
jgi:hypothetical protein